MVKKLVKINGMKDADTDDEAKVEEAFKDFLV